METPDSVSDLKTETPNPIASTISTPATSSAPEAAAEGGEWQELLGLLNTWLGDGKAKQIWEQSQRPLKAVGIAIVMIIFLRLLGAVLGTLDAIPMLPRLLELVGLIWLGLFAGPKLVKSDERKLFIGRISSAWSSFSGRQ